MATDWYNVSISPSGRQRVVTMNIDCDGPDSDFELMKKYAAILVAQGHVRKNTPYAMAKWCIHTVMQAMKNELDRVNERESDESKADPNVTSVDRSV